MLLKEYTVLIATKQVVVKLKANIDGGAKLRNFYSDLAYMQYYIASASDIQLYLLSNFSQGTLQHL